MTARLMGANRRATAVGLIACLTTGALLGGCVERRIFITSEPSGARVHLNDQDVGVTPVEVDFTWFGVYDVRLKKKGYEPLVTEREAKAPLHEVPGFDLVALAIPGTKRTHIEWHFEMEPSVVDEAGLLERAIDLRARLETPPDPGPPTQPGQETPPTPPAEIEPGPATGPGPSEDWQEVTSADR